MKPQPNLVATDSTVSVGPHQPRLMRTAGFHIAPTFLLPSVSVALLCYRLFDIDIIIRRTLVYSALTIVVGIVYVVGIVVSRALVAPLISGSELAIVASTLTIAALFNPMRKRIQNMIDQRFHRRKNDAAQVLAAFGATTRDKTDLDRLIAEMLRMVDETMQPEFVALSLRQPEREVRF
jgi:hypothetical protein